MTTPGPGWHPDPEGNQQLRYWDGQQWTSATQPMPQPTPSSEPVDPEKLAKDRRRALIGAGVVALLIAAYFGVNALANRKNDNETVAVETTTTTTEAAPTTTTTRVPTPPRNNTVPPPVRTTTTASSFDDETTFTAGLIMIDFPKGDSNEYLIEQGRFVCRQFDKGKSLELIGAALYASNYDWTAEQSGQLIGIAIGAFCPEYKNKLPR